VFEVVECYLHMLTDLDEMAVGVAHVATPLAAAIVERLSEKNRSFRAPFSVTSPDIGDAQVQETVYSVELRRGLENNLRLIGRRATAAVEDDPGIGQLDLAGVLRLDHVPAKDPHGPSIVLAVRKCVMKKPSAETV
jgi:hypothetical protein